MPDQDILTALINRSDLNKRDGSGRTALINACSVNKENVVQMLLDKGADRNIKDNAGMIALQWTSNEEIKELLSTILPAPPKPVYPVLPPKPVLPISPPIDPKPKPGPQPDVPISPPQPVPSAPISPPVEPKPKPGPEPGVPILPPVEPKPQPVPSAPKLVTSYAGAYRNNCAFHCIAHTVFSLPNEKLKSII